MSRTAFVRLLVVSLASAATLVVGAAAPAAAAPPEITHTKVDVTLTGIDQCGFTVNSVVRGTDTFTIRFDRAGNLLIQDTAHIVSTLTNVANGKVVHVDSAGRDRFTPDGVVNKDGTITFTDTLTGRDLRIYTAHSNVLLRDAGFLSMVTTIDAQGNVLSDRVVIHGPHQFAGDFDAYCDAITAAIG
jgi:hypothetical protein